MTKRSVVDDGFTELGLSGYVFSLPPEDIAIALTMLDALMARFEISGIRLQWPFAQDVSSVTGSTIVRIPAWAYSGVIAQLAIDLAGAFGKTPAPTTLLKAKLGFETMLAVSAIPRPVAANSYVPLGAGNKNLGVFVRPDIYVETTDNDAQIDVDGGELLLITNEEVNGSEA